MSDQKIRVRFAPSPTGYLHVGGARTALYNYLLAKQKQGTFVLRIEDTDRERSTPEAVQAILDGMKWLGLTWDEGPYYQTERFDLYQKHLEQLLAEKKAYPCFCTAAELEAKRALATAEKRKPMYDRTCLKLSTAEVERRIKEGMSHCIRFKSKDEGETIIHDVIKGDVTIANKELDDLIIRRSDGTPTYNFTVVVDDVTMHMTHIIRGDDHLNNTPRQIQLYEAFNYPTPLFAHVPMILGADKQRLSKRHGATSVLAYRDMGYLPAALINYLARIGWSYKDQEVFTPEELIAAFSLESCSGSAGVFNPEKLLWLNGVYIREANPQYLADLTLPFLQKKGIHDIDPTLLLEAVKVSQPKVKTILELSDMVDTFFVVVEPNDKLKEKFLNDANKPNLKIVYDHLTTWQDWTHDGLAQLFGELSAKTALGLGKLAQPVRVAVSGREISPGIFDTLRLLGPQKSLERLAKYL